MALRYVAVMCWLVWAGWAHAQTPPVVGTACSTSGNNATTVSFSCTASGTNRWVGVAVGLESSAQSVTSIAYGAGTPTSVAVIQHTTSGTELELYGLVNPATGSQTVQIVYDGFPDTVIGVLPLSDVHQSTPLGTAATAQASTSDTSTVNVSSAATARVIDATFFFFTGASGLTPGAGQTEHVDLTDAVIGMALGMSSESAASPTMSWTFAEATDGALIIAVPVLPLAAGAGDYFLRRRF